MSKNNDYRAGNLLNFAYFKENYKLIAIDLSQQIELEDPDLKQQINLFGKLEGQNNGATTFFITERSERTGFEFLQNSANII